jgi:serine/threonine-protein kinase RsbW
MDLKEMSIRNQREDMPAVVSMVETFGAAHNIPGIVINEINLALDEVLNNIISYGYPERENGNITVRLAYQPGEISAEVHDDGKPFDPGLAGPPDLSGTVQTRKVGGVGIHFVKQLMDEVVYARVGNKNRLLIRRRIKN